MDFTYSSDINLEIFSYLNIQDIITFSTVSHVTNQLANNTKLWLNITNRDYFHNIKCLSTYSIIDIYNGQDFKDIYKLFYKILKHKYIAWPDFCLDLQYHRYNNNFDNLKWVYPENTILTEFNKIISHTLCGI